MSYTKPGAATSTPGVPKQDPAITSHATSTSISPLRFEVVTTEAAQEKGLGGRESIPENYAMLFVFPTDQRMGFWMKDMLVPIDMIWLSDTGEVLGIEASVAPDSYPTIYYPPRPVRYVLETRAGEASRRGWTVGTRITLPSSIRLPNGS